MSPSTHGMCWVDLRAGLNRTEKRTFLSIPGLALDPSVGEPVVSRYTDCATAAHLYQTDRRTHVLPALNPRNLVQCL
jgi:hypothetical protein